MPDSSQSLANRSPDTVPAASSIRLLVLDLDGTTVGISNQIQPEVKQAIESAKASGVQIAIATGRMFRSATRFYQEIGSTLPLLSYQGALIKDPATQQIYRHWTVPQASALQLLDYFEQPDFGDQLSIHFYVDDCLYVRALTPASVAYGERTGVEPIPVGDLRQLLQAEPQREPTKILALGHPNLIDSLLISLRQQYTPAELYFTKSVATFFEAAHPQVNKGLAVKYLAEELLGLQPENVMAIGDNFNDLEMLEYAGVGVAMDNAPEAVKAAANWIAPDVEARGVAAAIEQFILRS